MANLDNLSDEDFLEAFENQQANLEQSETIEESEEEEKELTEEDVPEESAEDASADLSDLNEDEGGNIPSEELEPSSAQQKASEAIPEEVEEESEPDYRELYEKVLAPFKANGREIQPKNINEVIQLMQMGANYTRKMQDIAPHRKILTMLRNNELLDEDKLSFLIDLNKKDPAAIQKLLKDSEIDPLDIDVASESNYVAGNHHVADEEVMLNSVLEDVASTEHGAETIQVITKQWDQASKEVLWKEPSVISVINQQRSNGIYDKIVNEIERQKIFGAIPYGTPFIEAYKTVGQQMNEAGLLNTKKDPVARTTSSTNSNGVSNSKQAKAASTTRRTKSNISSGVDPLSLSDEEFLKYMSGRV